MVHSHADPIWPDGTFKNDFLHSLSCPWYGKIDPEDGHLESKKLNQLYSILIYNKP
jgi:hypothetical protein